MSIHNDYWPEKSVAQLIPSGEFVTSGEIRTAKYLRENLPTDWQVICNKTLMLPNGMAREVDFIILGRNRLFVVDKKGLRPNHGNESYWVGFQREPRKPDEQDRVRGPPLRGIAAR